MTAAADIRWSRQAARASRRQLVLWTSAALVMISAHAFAAWLVLGSEPEPLVEQVAGGAIEVDLAALGFASADSSSAGTITDSVLPTEAEAVETVETASLIAPQEMAQPVQQETTTPVEPAEPPTLVERPETVTPLRDVEPPAQVEAETAAPSTPALQEPLEATDQPVPPQPSETPAIESSRASDVTIAAASPVAPVEPEPVAPMMQQAVPVPVEEVEPVEEEQVAAIVNVPLPTPRPAYTPAAMPRAEKPRAEPQRQAEAPRAKPAPQQKKAEAPPPKRSGSGGNSNADTRQGAADGSARGQAANQGKRGNSQAGNAAVSNYPGKVRSKLSRALRSRGRESGEVHVSFVVDRSGGVSSVRIARSSGKSALDQAALDTVRRAAPFPPIPEGAGRSSWQFTIPLAFRR